MDRPIWLRILVQMGIALLVLAVSLPVPLITGRLIDHLGHLPDGRLLTGLAVVSLLWLFVLGGLTALLSAKLARRPWDALFGCALLSAFGGWQTGAVLLLGCALAAWLLAKRLSAPPRDADQPGESALLP